MKKLTLISIIFENTEYVIVQASDILTLCIKGISRSLHMDYTKDIVEVIACDYIELRLNKDILYKPWNGTYGDLPALLLNRLQCNDITSICIAYDNATEEQYYVSWDENSNDNNVNQNVEIQSYGKECIHVCIDKDLGKV